VQNFYVKVFFLTTIFKLGWEESELVIFWSFLAWCHWKPGVTCALSLGLMLDGLWRSYRRSGKLSHLPLVFFSQESECWILILLQKSALSENIWLSL